MHLLDGRVGLLVWGLGVALALGAATQPHHNVTTGPPRLPRNFAIVLFRAFELLDVFGPLNCLSLLAKTHQMNLYILSDSLAPVSTQPATASMNPKNSSFFPTIIPTHTLANAPSDIDVLIVPGGLGARAPSLGGHVDYIRRTYPQLRYLIAICTGAGLVAKTGLLDGRRATTNKAGWDSTVANGPKVRWVRRARWVVDGNVWTSSGLSAGLDATLAWIGNVYGPADATAVADLLEYERHPDSGWDPFSDVFANGTVARALGR